MNESAIGGPCPPPPPRYKPEPPYYEEGSVAEAEAEAPLRKIVQIATAAPSAASQEVTYIVALCNDGTIWEIFDRTSWFQLPFIPQPEASK
jgi:hypothetical protein